MATPQKMLNTPEQEAQAAAALEKVKEIHAKESGVEGPFLDAIIPIIKKLAPLALEALKAWLANLPSPSPNIAQN